MMSEQDDWDNKDATWELLGKSEFRKADSRFADDVLRAVRLLPESDPCALKVLGFSPWVAAAACTVLAAFLFLNPTDNQVITAPSIADISDGTDHWVEIEAAAEEEMIVAAANYLDRFSDQELLTLIGF